MDLMEWLNLDDRSEVQPSPKAPFAKTTFLSLLSGENCLLPSKHTFGTGLLDLSLDGPLFLKNRLLPNDALRSEIVATFVFASDPSLSFFSCELSCRLMSLWETSCGVSSTGELFWRFWRSVKDWEREDNLPNKHREVRFPNSAVFGAVVSVLSGVRHLFTNNSGRVANILGLAIGNSLAC